MFCSGLFIIIFPQSALFFCLQAAEAPYLDKSCESYSCDLIRFSLEQNTSREASLGFLKWT